MSTAKVWLNNIYRSTLALVPDKWRNIPHRMRNSGSPGNQTCPTEAINPIPIIFTNPKNLYTLTLQPCISDQGALHPSPKPNQNFQRGSPTPSQALISLPTYNRLGFTSILVPDASTLFTSELDRVESEGVLVAAIALNTPAQAVDTQQSSPAYFPPNLIQVELLHT
ncbi:hypothetical protein DSO57_1016918 [Entomophthora muscae]|uniref:Uncharacterized protein n=1 Tax=Entomophthora muscae TaxID=34485 RepID=A0ACC2SUA0_9FUNG|nr:hypothetical protein DSO57_1016918 [Entomophthora muscae]